MELESLDKVIDQKFIPALFNGRILNVNERKLVALPVKFGGLGIGIPSESSSMEYNNSRRITSSLVEHIKNQDDILELSYDELRLVRNEIRNLR